MDLVRLGVGAIALLTGVAAVWIARRKGLRLVPALALAAAVWLFLAALFGWSIPGVVEYVE